MVEDQYINEEWRDIIGYEGHYQISNLGRVKSCQRYRRGKKGSLVPMAEKIMKISLKKENKRTKPYAEIHLRDGSKREIIAKSFLVHRLVAQAFIKNLEPKEQVDHINGIHYDNRVENLRVMTFVEHGRIHPKVLNPNPRDVQTGRYIKP